MLLKRIASLFLGNRLERLDSVQSPDLKIARRITSILVINRLVRL
jgi:hypothetical protein